MQCIVISGESGSGKTESTNFLLHHLTALSQKGAHGSGVEQTILSAGPVLEAFGNAKTAHNNNSSRFGKFIQVNYRENGMVQGAVVQKYLLEKSRIVSQGHYERNYHVFYYLLSGATEQERVSLHLLPAEKYHYLNAKNLTLENCDEKYEFSRLKQSMEMVGFSAEKQRRLFAVLSAVLLLGNVEFFPKKSTYHHDESVQVRNPEVVGLISELLRVKQETLLSALTSKRVKASGETLIMQYKLPEAIAARDALAKCLYGALFDWIVLQVNHALLNKDQTVHTGHSIGVLDIFGFEDFGLQNSFEQLCINYANEHLQYYFNLVGLTSNCNGFDNQVLLHSSTCSNTSKRSTSGKASSGPTSSSSTTPAACSCSSRNRPVCSASSMTCASKLNHLSLDFKISFNHNLLSSASREPPTKPCCKSSTASTRKVSSTRSRSARRTHLSSSTTPARSNTR